MTGAEIQRLLALKQTIAGGGDAFARFDFLLGELVAILHASVVRAEPDLTLEKFGEVIKDLGVIQFMEVLHELIVLSGDSFTRHARN